MSEGAQGRQKCQWVSLGVKGVVGRHWTLRLSIGVKGISGC